MSHRPRALALWAALAALVVVALAPSPASAIPVFARRYGTSCQTCHVVFPRLTPFGEAFRRNAYRFPDGADEDFRRQQPQSLGASAYRDLFPNAVWPGELPSEVPLSVLVNASAAYQRQPAGSTAASLSFAGLAGLARFTASATLGERFSVWAGVAAAGRSDGTAYVELERAFIAITPFDRPYLNVRIGRYEPSILSFSSHRVPGPIPWLLGSTVGDNQFALEPVQLGIEATGVLVAGRGTYTLGLVEGAGNQLNTPKDFYGRLAFKIGGMRLDGVPASGDVDVSSQQPWREWSLQLGGFGYMGQATVGGTAASQDDSFLRVGGDLNATLGNLLVMAAYGYGRHERPSLASPYQSAESHDLMVQADYVVFPWLVPGVRYETRLLDRAGSDRLTASVYALVRANVRAAALAIFERPSGGSLDVSQIQASLMVGF